MAFSPAQAAADRPDTLDHVKALLGHPDMDVTNPNKFRTLIGGFARNMAHFHRADGKGYEFFADQARPTCELAHVLMIIVAPLAHVPDHTRVMMRIVRARCSRARTTRSSPRGCSLSSQGGRSSVHRGAS